MGKELSLFHVIDVDNDFFRVSHTTRKPHKEETAGKDYHFVTEEKLEMDIKMVCYTGLRSEIILNFKWKGVGPTTGSKHSINPFPNDKF